MLLVIERLFSIPWIYCLTRIRYLWKSRLAYIFRRGPLSQLTLRLTATSAIGRLAVDNNT